MQPFHSEVAVDAAHGQIAVLRLNGAVYDQNITLLYPLVDHRIAVDTAIEGRCRMAHNLVIEVERFRYIVLRRRWETGLNASVGIRQRHPGRRVGNEQFNVARC